MNEFCGQLKALTLRLSTVSTLNEMSSAMESASNAMCLVSNKLDPQKLQKMARDMELNSGKLEMNQEMMSSVLEDIGESMDDPIEEDKLYQDVLKEVGLEVQSQMVDAPQKKVQDKVENKEKDELEDMLNSLQK